MNDSFAWTNHSWTTDSQHEQFVSEWPNSWLEQTVRERFTGKNISFTTDSLMWTSRLCNTHLHEQIVLERLTWTNRSWMTDSQYEEFICEWPTHILNKFFANIGKNKSFTNDSLIWTSHLRMTHLHEQIVRERFIHTNESFVNDWVRTWRIHLRTTNLYLVQILREWLTYMNKSFANDSPTWTNRLWTTH